ncbi:FERM and PDZ domain-containing protein 4 [Trichonephila clavipes]|nr:FERM and PDZ domain-containing protein 4 [Trichonephila clavipes]
MPRIQLNSRAVPAFCVRSRAVGHDLHTSHVPRPHSADGSDDNAVKIKLREASFLLRSIAEPMLCDGMYIEPSGFNEMGIDTTRKSALLTAAKKAKLKSNPSRVRFAEGVVINGSPLYCPSPFDSHVPFMPNVLKVFLENGQTKSFKYDSTTTVQDVLNVLQEKLSINCLEHFSLVVEHIKSVRRNKLSILSPKDTLAKIAARPGAHHLRCLFRLTFVPKDIYDLMQRDPVAFDYLFLQSCNDVVKERFAPELKYDVALRLAALHLQQHAVSSGMQGKLVVKAIEREYGLEKFVPMSLLETMKRKELLKLLSQLMKQNQALSGPGQKQLTATQAKFHYLKIVSDLPTYGAKSFATCTKVRILFDAKIKG